MYPNFFIVGATKAGTTTLVDGLKRHPDVYMSPVKEPCYFAKDLNGTEYAKWHRKTVCNPKAYVDGDMRQEVLSAYFDDLENYRALFRDWAGQSAIGEASSLYMVSQYAAQEITNASPTAKIIMILREPVSRAYSEFLMNLRAGIATGSFSDALAREELILKRGEVPEVERYISSSLYCRQVERYLNLFPRDQILILFFEDLVRDQPTVFRKICDHIGIEYDLIPENPVHSLRGGTVPKLEKLNRMLFNIGGKSLIARHVPKTVKEVFKLYYYRTSPGILPKDNVYLKEVFAPDIAALEHLIGCDLECWRSSW